MLTIEVEGTIASNYETTELHKVEPVGTLQEKCWDCWGNFLFCCFDCSSADLC